MHVEPCAPAEHCTRPSNRPASWSPAAFQGPVPAAHLQAHKPCTHSSARGVQQQEPTRSPQPVLPCQQISALSMCKHACGAQGDQTNCDFT